MEDSDQNLSLLVGSKNFIQNYVITYFNHTTSFHGDNWIKLPKILFSIQKIALDILCVAEEPLNYTLILHQSYSQPISHSS